MNILLTGVGDTKYGASHSLAQMAVSLAQFSDVNLTVILNRESPIADVLRKAGIFFEILDYYPFYQGYPPEIWQLPPKYLIRGLQYLCGRNHAVRRAEELMNRSLFDIIHANEGREDLGAILANHYGIPLVWHIREFGDLDYRCYSYRRNYISFMNESATKFIAISDAVRDHWIKKGLDPQKIVRVYNGVRTMSSEKIKTRTGPKSGPVRFVIAGSLSETKGQMQAVAMIGQLWKHGINATLDIIGDGKGSYVRKLHEKVKTDGLENKVNILGYRNDVDGLLPDYDIGLVCSRSEGFGRVTAEYMMAGLPVLASDTGANPELIREGVDGYLYQYGNIDDMTEKALSVIAAPTLGGIPTHQYARATFSDTLNAQNIYDVYRDVLSSL